MSKELESLKRIVNEISIYKLHGLGDENWLGIRDVLKDVNILENTLTPPTSDEVCKALGEYLECRVEFIDNVFVFEEPEGVAQLLCGREKDYGTSSANIGFRYSLPPHLITLIGRFYEGLEK